MHASKVPKVSSVISHDQEMRSKDRIDFVMLVWLVLALCIVGRAFYVQVIQHRYYINLADKQYISKIPINFDRGNIYFSRYKTTIVPAAQLRTTYRITIDPTQITNAEALYATLNDALPLSKEDFLTKAKKVNDPYEEVAKDVSEDVIALLKKKRLVGVNYLKDNKRSYPQDTVGAKVIGFVGSDGVHVRGQYGLERYYDDVLTRRSSDTTINFFAELFTDIQKTVISNTDKQEGDIILTIDAEAQRVLHQTLIETKKTWNSDMIGGIIMDPKTGKIIAMDGLPNFDPNEFTQVKDPNDFINQNISGVYEMGSIIKPITMASAIDAGVVNEEKTTYNDTGFRELNGYKVKNFDGKARGPGT